jgi:multidrug efflux pump subunit AcrB
MFDAPSLLTEAAQISCFSALSVFPMSASAFYLKSYNHYEISGEFQELRHALGRLAITVPVSILIIFFLLYNTFRSLGDAALLLECVINFRSMF